MVAHVPDGGRAVIMLDDAGRGGTVLQGYEDPSEAVVTILAHLESIMHSQGKQLVVIIDGERHVG
jgi:hypothetical protein